MNGFKCEVKQEIINLIESVGIINHRSYIKIIYSDQSYETESDSDSV